MEELSFSYVNLLAFVQVGVALNFGLLYLDRNNAFAGIYKEFRHYLKALAHEKIVEAAAQGRRTRMNMPEDILQEKAKLNKYTDKIKAIYGKKFYFPFLACWGFLSGCYGFCFLLLVGALGWKGSGGIELLDYLILLAEAVFILEVWSAINLRNKVSEIVLRKAILSFCFSFLAVAVPVVLIMLKMEWFFRISWSMETCFLLASLMTYTPVFALLLLLLKESIIIFYYCCFCRFYTLSLQILLDRLKFSKRNNPS